MSFWVSSRGYAGTFVLCDFHPSHRDEGVLEEIIHPWFNTEVQTFIIRRPQM